MSDGLRSVTTPDLRIALARCASEAVALIDADRIRGWGVPSLATAVGPLGPVAPPVLTMLLECALAERDAPKAQVDVVWTGPHPRVSTARDTLVVMRDLFLSARTEVIVAGYSFDHGEALLRPLHARAQMGVRVAIFLDVEGKARSEEAVDAFAALAGQKFLDENWPFGAPFPELYFDHRTVAPGPYASMHAKCIVVDSRVALVGSANFTSRAQTKNIELGVVIEDPRLSTELAALWWSGVREGVFRRIRSGASEENAPEGGR
jgi:phosphatidylserine/phosphatidylglycerophosphate/cardiolipin synthase-like enzyme